MKMVVGWLIEPCLSSGEVFPIVIMGRVPQDKDIITIKEQHFNSSSDGELLKLEPTYDNVLTHLLPCLC